MVNKANLVRKKNCSDEEYKANLVRKGKLNPNIQVSEFTKNTVPSLVATGNTHYNTHTLVLIPQQSSDICVVKLVQVNQERNHH